MTTNDDLLYQIILSGGFGYRTKKLDSMFINMSASFVTRFTPPFNDAKADYVHTAYIACVRGLKSFDRLKAQPFPFFSECIKRAFSAEYAQLMDTGYAKKYKRDFEYVHSYSNL